MPISACFFLSGAAALILQVLWTRMLGHVFGATSIAVATTLTVFMAGLALGSHWAGRFAPRIQRPLLAFALLESLVGLYGLLVPTLIAFIPVLQRTIPFELGFASYLAFRFIAACLVLLLPTVFMGATLPLLAEGVVRDPMHVASKTGRLYAANTAGAVVGAFLGGFVLIPALGIERTVYAAAGIDLAAAAIVVLLHRLGGGDRILLLDARKEAPDDLLWRLESSLLPSSVVGPKERTLAVVCFGVSGAAAMALQVMWTRAVGVVIGASTYSFTLILTTFLVGLAAGAAFMSRFVDRVRDPVLWLARVQVAVGSTALVASLFVDRMPIFLHGTTGSLSSSIGDLYFTSFLIAALLTLPSTLALGAVMPLVVRILGTADDARTGNIVGRAYAVNTLGAIVGSFVSGFVLLPLLGVQRGLSLAACISVVLGVVLVVTRREGKTPVLVTALVTIGLAMFAPRWDARSWASGLFRVYLARSVYRDGWAPTGRVLYHKDGVATTVTVEQEKDGVGISLKVNGKVDASDIGDMPTQVLSGLLPVLVHPDPEEVLVIGYGSGVTPGAVLESKIRSLHVAEIEASVYEAANRHFGHVNHRPWLDARAKLFVDDGRNFLLTRNHRYDIIISEPSNPWMTGAASLFTLDFFEIAKTRLKPGGVFLQWLQLYELSAENIGALLRTFRTVFPHVLVFTPSPLSNDTLLIGAIEPIALDAKRLEAAFLDPKLRTELERANVRGPRDLLGLFLTGWHELAHTLPEGPLNTDDNALIEFNAPKDLLTYSIRDPELPFFEAIEGLRFEKARKYFTNFDYDGPDLVKFAESLLSFGRSEDADRFLSEAEEMGTQAPRLRRMIEYGSGADREPVVIVSPHTKGDVRYVRVIAAMNEGRDKDALTLFEFEKDMENEHLEHRFLYAYLCYRNERDSDAEYLMRRVLEDEAFVAENPSVLYYAGRMAMVRGRFQDALAYFERFDASRP